MKICIDEGQCRVQGMDYTEVLALLLVKSGKDIPKLLDSLEKKEAIVKEATLFDGVKYVITQAWDDRLMAAILNAEYADPDSMDERIEHLAKSMQELFPKGKKEGTVSSYWRGNTNDIKLKLKKFFKLYGNYTDEQIIEATRNYVSSFNGDYRFMRLLKYFIWKDDRKMNESGVVHIESVSELASCLENAGQDTTENRDWTANLI